MNSGIDAATADVVTDTPTWKGLPMSTVLRGKAAFEGEVSANIDDVWDLLLDWANLDWLINDVSADGMKLGKCHLEGEKDAQFRVRVMTRANVEGTGLPLVNREVLLREDRKAYRFYYDCVDGFMQGIRNYIANWALDPLPNNRCNIQVEANFDVMEDGDMEKIRATLVAVYDSMIRGLNLHFQKQPAQSA